jgi:hypothetical protein
MIKRLLLFLAYAVLFIPLMIIGMLSFVLKGIAVLFIWIVTGKDTEEMTDEMMDRLFWWITFPDRIFKP